MLDLVDRSHVKKKKKKKKRARLAMAINIQLFLSLITDDFAYSPLFIAVVYDVIAHRSLR